MQNYIYFGMLAAFCIMMFSMYSIMDEYRTKSRKLDEKNPTIESNPTKQKDYTQDDYELILTHMLTHNVIDQQTYNRLLVNGLLTFKG
jgi:hypothetical protein